MGVGGKEGGVRWEGVCFGVIFKKDSSIRDCISLRSTQMERDGRVAYLHNTVGGQSPLEDALPARLLQP
jgi:hypothetical protein